MNDKEKLLQQEKKGKENIYNGDKIKKKKYD